MGQKETGGHPEYHQIPMEGLRLAAHKPTSLSTEADVKQGLEEASGGMPTIYKNLKAINLAFVREKNPKDGWVCRKELVRIIRNNPQKYLTIETSRKIL